MTNSAAHLRDALADRYTIERELDRGGMATVWLARHLKHDRLVTVKVLRAGLSATAELVFPIAEATNDKPHSASLSDPHVRGKELRVTGCGGPGGT